MDAPSPEPPAAPAAAAPAPAGIIADAVAAVADAAAAVAGDPLASGSSSNSSDGAQDSLEFDSTAACVGLGGSAWTCFKKELPDSQIATRCGIEWERARASERGREFTKREQSIEEGEKENDAPLLSRLLLLLLLTHFFTPLLPPSYPLPPPNQPNTNKQTNKQNFSSLWLWTAVGLACLLLFCALLHLIPTYRTRLFLPNLVREEEFRFFSLSLFRVLGRKKLQTFSFFSLFARMLSRFFFAHGLSRFENIRPFFIQTVGRPSCSPHGRRERRRRERQGEPRRPPPPSRRPQGGRPPPPLAPRRLLAPLRLARHRRDDPGRRPPRVRGPGRAGADVVLQTGDAGEGVECFFFFSENYLSFFFSNFDAYFFFSKLLITDLLPSRPRRPLRPAPRQHPRAGSEAGSPQLRGGSGGGGGKGLKLLLGPGLPLAGGQKRDQGRLGRRRRRRGGPAGVHLLLEVHRDQPAAGVAAALVRLRLCLPLDVLDPFSAAAVQQGVSRREEAERERERERESLFFSTLMTTKKKKTHLPLYKKKKKNFQLRPPATKVRHGRRGAPLRLARGLPGPGGAGGRGGREGAGRGEARGRGEEAPATAGGGGGGRCRCRRRRRCHK